ncbi:MULTISPECIES: hypothetical protein [Algoriphagus]|uniref:Lipoprotein n=2 Tax=Algoriphagus TaxID=246875 RepID=A0A5C7B292_9BACT|nr:MULTISPECIES: hypothetical protein [Algoriphagus]MDP2041143.1 hypothetical protein [Algoriphagus sp.]MDP3471705.1 hypothetical protein [Algoriphagus sp.]TXE14093.1 hypothetical protein ESV85_00600 [Algoriphagus aquimarinus]
MNKAAKNISKNKLRDFFVFAAMLLVLLTSCPIKNGLLSLADIPVNTEQGSAKKTNLISGYGVEKCFYSETADTIISQEISISANDLLPALLLTATFLFLLGYIFCKEQSHPLYGNLKIYGTLPIFLQYRKLIL